MSDSPVLLVLDDEDLVAAAVRQVGEEQGFRVVTRRAAEDPARQARDGHALALVARVDPRTTEASIARLRHDLPPRCRFIALAAAADPTWWGRAIAGGAYGALTLPVEAGDLARLLHTLRGELAQRRDRFASDLHVAQQFACAGMIGRGPAMHAIFERARRTAPHLRAALITGEPGAGKQTLARALHALGPRHARPFVVVDGETAGEALDVALFGPDAPRREGDAHAGLLSLADGGVVYVGNITELSPRAQDRLLSVVECGHWLDDDRARRVNVTVLAGAPRHPAPEVHAGRFSRALLARLACVEFPIPALRERREDIAPLAAVFLREAAARAGKAIVGFSTDAEALLTAWRWPGNVRQLQWVVARAALLADGDFVVARDVAAAMPALDVPLSRDDEEDDAGRPLSSVEREHIARALQRAGGNKKAAARMLGVSRRALYRKLERLDLGSTIARRASRHDGDGTSPVRAVS